MIHIHRLLALAALSSTLAACAGPAIPGGGTSPRPTVTAPPPPTIVRPVQQNSLIGSNVDAIGRMFGNQGTRQLEVEQIDLHCAAITPNSTK